MSIIYDALKKSQQKRAVQQPKVAAAKRPGKLRQNLVITLLFLTCLFTILMAATMPNNNKLRHAKLLKSNEIVKPIELPKKVAIIPKLNLNGVFLSDQEQMALINNKSYHLGDKLYGMTIDMITLEQVTLKNDSRTITLRNDMTEGG